MSVPNRPIGAGLATGGLWPAHVPRPQAPGASVTARPVATTGTGPASIQEVALDRLPWKGVEWTLSFVGLLGFVFAVTTYRFPIGNVSMVIALVGLLTQKERLRVPPMLVGFGLFLLWCVVGYSVSTEPKMVLDKLEEVAKLWLIGLVAANALRSRAQVRFFVVFFLACFAFYPVRGALFNYYIYGETLFGRAKWNYIFSNPNDLAAFCILQLAMALGLLSLEQRGPARLGTIAGMAVLPFVILQTRSRGAFLAFAGFVLLVLAGHRRRGRATLVTLLMAGIVIAIAPPDVLNRVQGLENATSTENLQAVDAEGSAFQRYEIWKVARAIIREHPIAGVGIGAYPAAHQRMARRGEFDPTALGRRDTHSAYLNITAETGFVGATIYFLTLIISLVRIDRIRRRAKPLLPATSQTLYIYEAGTLAYFVAAVFGSILHVTFFILHLFITWSVAEIAANDLATLAAGGRNLSAPRSAAMDLVAAPAV